MSHDRTLINYKDLSNLLNQLQFPMTVSEIHGLVLGLIIGEKNEEKRMTLLYELTNEGESFPHELREAIIGVSEYSIKGLLSEDSSFELLLPDNSYSVFDRLDALVEWVNHFLLGLGVTRVDIATFDGDIKEIFSDFREITKLGYDLDDDEKELASDLEKVMEYVKISVLIYNNKFNPTSKEIKGNQTNKNSSTSHPASLIINENKTLH
ncbi:UPF0149 family protein [Thorsellia kenyensis]|uniref:UPF0149 family protein n=1 Tax=Thorsellia kenyensis TaxID=1549888 RepID=A0ABV6C6N5_9GAMM